MRILTTITLLFISSLGYGQGIWNQVNGNSKFWRLKADSVLIIPRDTSATNNAFYLGATVGDSGRLAYMGGKLWLHSGEDGWKIVGSDLPDNLLDSARRSNDTLYFRTTSGGEIAIKMEGIEIAGVNGLQDSLTARYTKAQADARFIQGNQSITLSGDVTGSGTTAITTALKNTGTAGTYTKVTTDPEGRVSSGTTLSAGDIPDLSATYIPITQKGAASGVATLGMDGKVPSSQLPTTGSLYQGTWNASTNTPTIADGVGTAGWYYRVNVAGTQDLGSGNITFSVGDDVIYNGSVWQRIPAGSAVNSVNGYTGDVVLGKADVGLGNVDNTSDLAKPVSTATQTALNLKANSAITLTAGTGLTGGGNLTANRSFAVNFGTAAGTVAQGNDSRINNGQTAFGWGNHASAGYWKESNHPAGITGSITYTGAEVPASLSFNSVGHYTANGKRTLTAGDIGATPESPSASPWSAWLTIPSGRFVAASTGAPNAGTWYGIHMPGDASNSAQIAFKNGSGFFRTYDAGAGGSWLQIADRSWVTSNFAPVSGSGNYIQNGTSSQTGNFNITGVGRANNFGIGTAVSTEKLGIAAGSSVEVQFNGAGTANIYHSTASQPMYINTNNADLYIGAGGSGSQHITALSGGNVGIGTTTPATKLDVNGTITAPVLQSPSGENLVLLANSAPTGAQVTLTTDGLGIGGMPGGTHTARLLVAGNAVANDAWVLDNNAGMIGEWFIDGANAMGLRTTTNHDLNFYANDQKRMEIGKEGVITTTAGIASHSRLVSTASAFTINPQDYVVIMEGMGTGAGDGILITLPDPSTNGGRLLEFHEYSASAWATNYSIRQPNGASLTTITGVMVIRAVNGDWRLVSKH